ncbi:MAG: CorA family divalent cation transporter, partial [Phycisphaerales bacterium JB040]
HPRETARQGAAYRQRLTLVRRQSISLRRYLAPQRDALVALASEQHESLAPHDRAAIRRAADQTARCVEDLDELRDRAAVATDELRARQDERIGRTSYLLTLVATIALPLGLITGLFGINVGGMPGVESPGAFWIVTVGMIVLSAAGIALFKFIRWL